jgi:hypothetical protein
MSPVLSATIPFVPTVPPYIAKTQSLNFTADPSSALVLGDPLTCLRFRIKSEQVVDYSTSPDVKTSVAGIARVNAYYNNRKPLIIDPNNCGLSCDFSKPISFQLVIEE